MIAAFYIKTTITHADDSKTVLPFDGLAYASKVRAAEVVYHLERFDSPDIHREVCPVEILD